MLLAEISDKTPTIIGVTVVACLMAAASVGLGLIRRWLILLPLPAIAFYDWAACDELFECGYNLTGNVTGRCPECGTTVSMSNERTGADWA
jgi:hypothetical protein